MQCLNDYDGGSITHVGTSQTNQNRSAMLDIEEAVSGLSMRDTGTLPEQ